MDSIISATLEPFTSRYRKKSAVRFDAPQFRRKTGLILATARDS